jgi:hypothetical protein
MHAHNYFSTLRCRIKRLNKSTPKFLIVKSASVSLVLCNLSYVMKYSANSAIMSNIYSFLLILSKFMWQCCTPSFLSCLLSPPPIPISTPLFLCSRNDRTCLALSSKGRCLWLSLVLPRGNFEERDSAVIFHDKIL